MVVGMSLDTTTRVNLDLNDENMEKDKVLPEAKHKFGSNQLTAWPLKEMRDLQLVGSIIKQ